jgi:hypothetical protein
MKRLTHKTLLISIIALLALLALPVGVLADSDEGENEFTQTVNGYRVTVSFEKPASVGENPIHIQLFDANNMPVSGAVLEVSVSEAELEHGHTQPEADTAAHDEMQGMPGMEMPGMDMSGASEHPAENPVDEHSTMDMTTLEAGHESGEYAGEVTFDQAGECVLKVHLTVQGQLTQVDFPLSVTQSHNGSSILAVFFAINVVIVGAALVMKSKSVSVKNTEGSVE